VCTSNCLRLNNKRSHRSDIFGNFASLLAIWFTSCTTFYHGYPFSFPICAVGVVQQRTLVCVRAQDWRSHIIGYSVPGSNSTATILGETEVYIIHTRSEGVYVVYIRSEGVASFETNHLCDCSAITLEPQHSPSPTATIAGDFNVLKYER